MLPRRILAALAAAVAVVAAASGCSSDDPPETPAACLQGPGAYVRALSVAPAEVRLEDGTPISSCLVEEQDPGALAAVGESLVAAATRLNAEVRRDFDPDATIALGYLVGAVDRGAESTGGIHQDLRLRISSAARFVPGSERRFGAEFERSYNQGYAAGRESG